MGLSVFQWLVLAVIVAPLGVLGVGVWMAERKH